MAFPQSAPRLLRGPAGAPMSQEKSAQLRTEWENANAELGELREKYGIVARTLRPGERVQRPHRTATPKARKEIQALERKVNELRKAYERAIREAQEERGGQP